MALNCDVSFAGVGSDLEGSPADIRSGAQGMTKAGENLRNAANAVEKLVNSTDEIISKAFKAVGDKAGVVTQKLRDAGWRYRRIAEKLNGFADVLEAEQAKARQHAQAYREAQTRVDNARSAHAEAANRARSMDPETQRCAVLDAQRAGKAHTAAVGDQNAAIRGIRCAAASVREANEATAKAIETVSNVSGVEDSILDRIGAVLKAVVNAVVKVAKWIWDNIETICLVLDFVALVLSVIPGVNIAAGALKVVTTLARVASFVSKAKSLCKVGGAVVKAIEDPTGKNVMAAFTSVGTLALGKAAKKVLSKPVEKAASAFGARTGAYVDHLRRANPKVPAWLPAVSGRAVYYGSKFVVEKSRVVAVRQVKSWMMDQFKPRPRHVCGGGHSGGGGGW